MNSDLVKFTKRVLRSAKMDLPSTTATAYLLDLFLGTIVRDLLKNGECAVPAFGRFVLDGRSVRFKPAGELTSMLEHRRIAMEKYGVEQSKDEGTKTAAKAGTCPECGKPLETSAMVHKCPVHGTKPFEAKKEDTDGQGKP